MQIVSYLVCHSLWFFSVPQEKDCTEILTASFHNLLISQIQIFPSIRLCITATVERVSLNNFRDKRISKGKFVPVLS